MTRQRLEFECLAEGNSPAPVLDLSHFGGLGDHHGPRLSALGRRVQGWGPGFTVHGLGVSTRIGVK